MVKFGRHLEAAAQQQRAIGSVGSDDEAHFESYSYVVPYNEMKSNCIPPYSKAFGAEEKKEDEAEGGQQESTRQKLTHSEKKKLPLPVLNSDDVYFCCQIFKTEWRQCELRLIIHHTFGCRIGTYTFLYFLLTAPLLIFLLLT